MKKNVDGSVTLYIQKDDPGVDKKITNGRRQLI